MTVSERRPGRARRGLRRRGSAAAVSLLLASAACGGPEPTAVPVGGEPVVRLIGEEPERLFDPGSRLALDEHVEACGRPWKIAVGKDLRNALLLPPGSSVERRLRVVGEAELRAWVGLPAGVDRPVSFRASVREPGCDEVMLFERQVGPGADRVDRWWPVRAGLEPWIGRDVTLVFEAAAGPGMDRTRGIPLLANPEVVAAGSGDSERLNLILISIDTLRADHLSLLGYPLPTSPNIDRWAAAAAAVFESVVAPAPWTLPSHVSLLTGLDALRHGINHDVGGLGAGNGGDDAVLALDFLAEILSRSGYETAGFTGGAYLHPRYGFAQGFDRFVSWPDRARDGHELEVGVDNALALMAGEGTRPFFVFLHTYAVHDPYRARPGFYERVSTLPGDRPTGRVALKSPETRPETGFLQQNVFVWRPPDGGQEDIVLDDEARRRITAMYDSGIAYMDEQIGRLLDGMRELGVADRTVIVLTSDHGESLGDAGRAGHIYLSDDNLLVPLLIAVPGGAGAGRRIERQVRLIDVAPTVLELLGIERPAAMDGVSLAPLLRGGEAKVPAEAWSYAAASNRGLSLRLDNRLKLTLNTTAWFPATSRRGLFDLERDPAESVDLAAVDRRAGALHAAADAYLEAEARGLRLRLQTGDGHLRGRLLGPMVRPVGTKVIGMDGPFLGWVTMGEATVDAPPGSDFTVVFEKVFGRDLTFEGRLGLDGAAFPIRYRVDVVDLHRSQALILDGGRWRRVARVLAEGEIGLAVEWCGDVAMAGPPSAVHDEQLAEQLRALGYIE
ncbi:MAG TPA: sulfatase [Candidatus Sulfomarinibacteraceae bacterium]|nr:sulfatase [Candidatus Sulfomarinibacteraceae bacterium]